MFSVVLLAACFNSALRAEVVADNTDLKWTPESCDSDVNSLDECVLLQTGVKLQESSLSAESRSSQSSDDFIYNTQAHSQFPGNHGQSRDGLFAILSKAATSNDTDGKKETEAVKDNTTETATTNLTAKAPKTSPLTSADYATAILAFSTTAVMAYLVLWYTTLHSVGPSATFAPLVAEFLGTFALVFTVGCCSTAGSSTWNATAIAAVLMAMIYATAPVSGGHLNPAVSFCLGLIGKESWSKMISYCAVQVFAGICASLSICLVIAPIPSAIGPVAPFHWWQAGLVEVVYTAMLCFVVLNCACVKTAEGNRFFSFAIGFVIIAGGYPCGNISGAHFNPAVSLGLELVSSDSIGWGFAWVVFQCIGAAIAAGAIWLVRPEERYGFDLELSPERKVKAMAKFASEFLGTFILVLTVGLNIITKSGATAWSASAALMCMIYSLGDVSGAHFNPAVSLAIVLAGRGKCRIIDASAYVVVQAISGCLAGLMYGSLQMSGPTAGDTFPLAAGASHSLLNASVGEFIFTALLAFTVLAVATTKKPEHQPVLHYFAFCIGACVMVGGTCLGKVSGGELNPAVSLGIFVSTWLVELSTDSHADSGSGPLFYFMLFQMLAGVVAALVFRLVHMAEYDEKNFVAKYLSKYLAEFLGTFYLVLTVGFCSLGGSATWNPLAIALVLMVMVYGLGSVSGAHLNPAVSLTLGFSKKCDVATMVAYWFVQICAGILAGVSFCAFFDKDVPIKPQSGFTWVQAAIAEVIYTSMLCFVVTQCAAASGNNLPYKNQFYGLAIGFVIVAGGYAVGGISGACFNPAVTLGLSASSALQTMTGNLLQWGLVWSVFELLGAAVAFALFRIMRPIDFDGHGRHDAGHTDFVKCLAEFIGVFFLVMTVGLNVISASPATALSAAAALMCMIYSLGDISGAHLNPAVTMAVVMSGREKCSISTGISYVLSHLLAAIMAGHFYAGFHMAGPNKHITFPLEPAKGYSFLTAGLLEMFFTGVLAYTVLAVATTHQPQPYNFGLTIASCVIAGGFAVGSITGGELNPAVSLGISFANLGHKGYGHQAPLVNFVPFGLWELSGGMIAAVIFRLTHPEEYNEKGLAATIMSHL